MAGQSDILMVGVGLTLAGVAYYVLINNKSLLDRITGIYGPPVAPPDPTEPAVPQPQETTYDQAAPVPTGPAITPPPNILSMPLTNRIIELVNENADKAGLTRPQIDDLIDQLEDYQDDLKKLRKMIPSERDRFANTIAIAIVNNLQDPLLVKVKRDQRHKRINYTLSAPKGWDIDVDKVRTRLSLADYY